MIASTRCRTLSGRRVITLFLLGSLIPAMAAQPPIIWQVQGHDGHAYGLAISPNGMLLATSGEDGKIKLWNARTGELLWTYDYTKGVRCLAFSPEGTELAAGSIDPLDRAHGEILVLDVSTGGLLLAWMAHTGYVNSLAYSPDGQWIASASGDLTIGLWQASDGELVNRITGHGGSIYGVAFTPDGQTIVTVSGDETVRVWSIPDGASLQTLHGHAEPISSVLMLPGGQRMVTAGNDWKIRVWRLVDGQWQAEQVLTGHTSAVNTLALSRDGKRFFSGSEDRTLRRWSLPDGMLQETYDGISDGILTIACPSGRGQFLAYTTKDGIVAVVGDQPAKAPGR